jgi:hypothetical protein
MARTPVKRPVPQRIQPIGLPAPPLGHLCDYLSPYHG